MAHPEHREPVGAEELLKRKQDITKWWNRSGLIYTVVKKKFGTSEEISLPPIEAYLDPEGSAESQDLELRSSLWPGCMLPHASTYIGPGSLCIFAGSEPEQVDSSIWFHERPDWEGNPEDITFDPENIWWQRTLAYIGALKEQLHKRLQKRHAMGEVYIPFPDLVENWDVLASLRGANTLLMDMIDRPHLVEQQLQAVQQLYWEVYHRLYEMIRDPRGASMYEAFYLWAPGRTAKLQCDGSAMFGPEMFSRFVLPGLEEQCQHIDYTMYHLDGTQCIIHLDAILGIKELDAVEWTPQAGQPSGTDPCWFDIYRKSLAAGKSVQILVEDPSGIPDLLNAIGTEGIYLLGIGDAADIQLIESQLAPFLGRPPA